MTRGTHDGHSGDRRTVMSETKHGPNFTTRTQRCATVVHQAKRA